MKVIKVADGAYFVPSYSEQTIVRSYTADMTVQSFGFDDGNDDDHKQKDDKKIVVQETGAA